MGEKLDLEKLRSIGYLGRGRTRSVSVSGREHPETGLPYKVTKDGNTLVTEHGDPGSAVSSRQDVEIRADSVN
jgi:hypothetical protein